MGLRRQVLAILREVIDFDAYVWLLTDPVTTVGAAPLADVPCLPELPALIKAKYATPVNRWTALRHPAGPVGRLAVAVDGDLARSLVWREVMSRYAVGDVASVVFADQFGCWGFLDLWRSARTRTVQRRQRGLPRQCRRPADDRAAWVPGPDVRGGGRGEAAQPGARRADAR